MKYPYIGINKAGTRALFFSRVNQFVISPGGGSSLLAGHNYNSIIPEFYENITHECLQNTYGEVQSPEHAGFIIELAELHGYDCEAFELANSGYFYTSGNRLHFTEYMDAANYNNKKQITIPLPPKADKQELSEWPKIGDEVATSMGKGVVKLPPDEHGYYIVLIDGQYIKLSTNQMQKPKTPEEELRDYIVWLTIKHMENKPYSIEDNAYHLFSDLMGKYNITKKCSY